MKPIIYIYNTAAAGGVDFDSVGQITSYSQLEFTPAWNQPGSFSITVNKNNLGAAYLAVDRIVYVDNESRKFTGYIDSIDIQQKENRSNELVVVSGTELKDQLYRPTIPPTGYDTDSYYSDKVETIAKSLINKNAGPGAVAARQINGLVLAEDQARGSVIDFSTRHKELLGEVFSLLAVDRLGLTVDYDPDAQTITYDVAEGVNRTESQSENSQVILSTEWKTALEYVYKKDKSAYRNVAITAGQGEGKDRSITVVGETGATGYARREMFVDARDVADDLELPDRGAQKLAEAGKSIGISIKHNNNGAFKIDEHFKVGDFVTATATDNTGAELKSDSQVIKATYSFGADSGSPDVSLVLDFDPDDIGRVIANKLRNYDSLLSSDGANSPSLDFDSRITQNEIDIANIGELLWSGSWNSGNITVAGFSTGTFFVFMIGSTAMLVSRLGGTLRGIGGYRHPTAGHVLYSFAASYSEDVLTFGSAGHIFIVPAGNISSETTDTVTTIYRLK